mmetsp:Transcript_22402/g.64311  ORF Transcript_22402/g.64311 Transcript_22402/m.64311 type:complete len:246 (+) Transcript_22402:304-1041(+)
MRCIQCTQSSHSPLATTTPPPQPQWQDVTPQRHPIITKIPPSYAADLLLLLLLYLLLPLPLLRRETEAELGQLLLEVAGDILVAFDDIDEAAEAGTETAVTADEAADVPADLGGLQAEGRDLGIADRDRLGQAVDHSVVGAPTAGLLDLQAEGRDLLLERGDVLGVLDLPAETGAGLEKAGGLGVLLLLLLADIEDLAVAVAVAVEHLLAAVAVAAVVRGGSLDDGAGGRLLGGGGLGDLVGGHG